MGKLVALGLLAGLLAGAVLAYNLAVHDVLEPLPVAWTRSPEELRLLELERARRAVAGRLGSARRVGSLSGLAGVSPTDPAAELGARLAELDRQIAALRAEIARRAGR